MQKTLSTYTFDPTNNRVILTGLNKPISQVVSIIGPSGEKLFDQAVVFDAAGYQQGENSIIFLQNIHGLASDAALAITYDTGKNFEDDNVESFTVASDFPAEGLADVLYLARNAGGTPALYEWTGSAYVQVGGTGGGSSSFTLMNDSNLDSGWFSGVANEKPYAVDTTSGPAFCQLPASPSVGDTIEFADAKGTWNTHGFTISRNGKKIEGLDVDYLDTAQDTQFFVVYIDDATGWKIYESGTKPHILVAPTAPTGTPQVGSLLTADNGTWTGYPTSYSYQWKNSPDGTTWTDISGATSATYTLQTSDTALYVDVLVTANNSNGASFPSQSAATAIITLVTLLSSLLAFYGMADLTDASGNGNDLTDTGGTTLSAQSGINGALFDGSGATFLANPTLSLGPVWSFSYWVYVIDDTSNNEYPCMGGVGATEGTQLVFVGGDRNSDNGWLHEQVSEQDYGQFQYVPEGAWNHHLIIGDSTNGLRWFIDGTEIEIGSPVYDLTKTGFMLGQNTSGQAFNGLIGPTSIWNRALTSGEATALYNAGAPLPYSSYATTP